MTGVGRTGTGAAGFLMGLGIQWPRARPITERRVSQAAPAPARQPRKCRPLFIQGFTLAGAMAWGREAGREATQRNRENRKAEVVCMPATPLRKDGKACRRASRRLPPVEAP